MDIEQARAEYVTTKITYGELAKKYGVNKSYICRQARKDGWTRQREAFRRSVASKAIESMKDRGARQLAHLTDYADKLVDAIGRLMQDSDQWYRWRGEDGDEISRKADTKALKNASAALRETTMIIRNLYGIPDRMEDRRDRREERKVKAIETREMVADESSSGIVIMPQPLEGEPDDAPVVDA